jgi:hypothetical protein
MKFNRGIGTLIVGLVLGGVASTGWAQSDPAGEEEPTVTGVERQRADGRFLGLAVEGNAFVIRFYTVDKEEEAVDVVRATARWNSPQKAGQQRVILNPTGQELRSPPVVRPPLVFSAFISFLNADGEVTESFNFNLQELNETEAVEPAAPRY